jgi:hypothetical protein
MGECSPKRCVFADTRKDPYNRCMKPDVRWSPELWRHLCEELASGRSLKKICDDPGMPTRQAVTLWVASDRDLAEQYFIARRAGGLVWADDVIDMSDESRSASGDMALMQSFRLSVDSRKWLLSKLHPDQYGDRISHAHEHQVQVRLPAKHGQTIDAQLTRGVLLYNPDEDGG